MTRAEFIKTWCRAVDAGRVKNFPAMRLSERACAQANDEFLAEKIWRKWRMTYTTMTVEQFEAEIAAGMKLGAER